MKIITLMSVSLLALSLVACGKDTEKPTAASQTASSQETSPQNTQERLAANTRERLAARAKNIEIIRDDYGVPHIYAKTDADAVFGLLYAQAEDDFPRIERNYIWATGRLAEIEGEEALYSDLRARLYMTIDEAKAAYNTAPDDVKSLCDAFADGLNFYLQANPDVKPKLLTRFEPWMPMFFSEGSIGGDIEQIPLQGIKAFYEDGTPRTAPLKAPTRPVEYEEPSGSNGFALSGTRTQSGNAMLLINPHTSFYFRPEVHVVSEEGLNAYGAVTWGQFFVYQGFSEKNGWMHTSTYVDFIDHFRQEVFDKEGELYYRYGDEARRVKVSSVTLKYKDNNTMKERTFPMYHTHHGPITHMEEGPDGNNQWVVTKINWDPVNALKQSFLRTKTNGHSEFNQMMDIRTNSSNNTVYADQQGNIAYYHGNFIPVRDPQFNYSKSVDGANPKTDWQGTHSVDEAITLLNPANGWIQNANSTPFTAAGEYSPKRENYPPYMAPDKENTRGLHAVQILQNASNVSLDSLIDLAYDPKLPAFEMIIPSLLEAYNASNKDPDLNEAISKLENWDHSVSGDSVAMALAHFYGMEMLTSKERPSGLSRLETYEYYSRTASNASQIELLRKAMKKMDEDFGTWNTPWGEINRFQRITGDIDHPFDDNAPSHGVPMASGRWGALAAFGARATNSTKKLYGYRGNSFVAVVEFGDKVKAKSLLAGGQSGNPTSKHFNDQILPYINKQFKDVAYYRDDVEKRAVRKYHPGE